MSCVLTIPMTPHVLSLYEECKTQCNFSHKTHSDFLVFLLNSAVKVVTLVREFSPIFEAASTPPTSDDNVFKAAELPQEGKKQDTGSKSLDKPQRINSPVSEEILEHSNSESLVTPSAVEELLTLFDNNPAESLAVEEPNLINNVNEFTREQFKPDTFEIMDYELAHIHSEDDEKRIQHADENRIEQASKVDKEHYERNIVPVEDSLQCDKLVAEHFKNYAPDINVKKSLIKNSIENYPEENLQFDIEVCKEGPWRCSECMNHYSSRSSFRRHICRQGKSLLSNMITDQYAVRQPNDRGVDQLDKHPNPCTIHACRLCGELYSSRTGLMMHLKSRECITMTRENAKINKLRRQPLTTTKDIKEMKAGVIRNLSQKNFKCPKCNAALASKRSVRVHLKNKQCRKKCHICGFDAYRGKILLKHMRDYHSLPNLCRAKGDKTSEEILPKAGHLKASQVIKNKMSPLQVVNIKTSQQKLYNCQYCEFSTHSAGGFGSHVSNKKHSL